MTDRDRAVANIWERPEFTGLSPSELDELARAGAAIRTWLEGIASMRRGGHGPNMFLHEFLGSFRAANRAIVDATGRGVTINQLADALGLTPKQIEAFTNSHNPADE